VVRYYRVRLLVVHVAVPIASNVPVPTLLAPSKKFTVPVGMPLVAATPVAVNVAAVPGEAEVADDVSAVAELARVTVKSEAWVLVLVAKFAWPE
jgi:hypothetical protein